MECAFLTFIKSFFFFLRLRLKSFSKFRKYLCKLMPEKWIDLNKESGKLNAGLMISASCQSSYKPKGT